MVKLLSSVFQGHFKNIISKTVNADFPGKFKYATPYVAMLVCNIFSVNLSYFLLKSQLLISAGLWFNNISTKFFCIHKLISTVSKFGFI